MRKIGWLCEEIHGEDDEPLKQILEVAQALAEGGIPPPPPTTLPEVAEREGLDVALSCPVCRSLDPCSCEEADRSFVRRVRFTEDVEKVPRCPRCGAPLCVVYLMRRAGAQPPYRLAQFEAAFQCAICAPSAVATLALSSWRSDVPF